MIGVRGVPWTDEERAQLRRLHENGMSQGQIGKLMGRSANSIHRQMTTMGLPGRCIPAAQRQVGHPRAPKTTLPPLPSLSMRGDGECKAEDEPWDGTGWPRDSDFWP